MRKIRLSSVPVLLTETGAAGCVRMIGCPVALDRGWADGGERAADGAGGGTGAGAALAGPLVGSVATCAGLTGALVMGLAARCCSSRARVSLVGCARGVNPMFRSKAARACWVRAPKRPSGGPGL